MMTTWPELRLLSKGAIKSALAMFPDNTELQGEQFLGELLRLMGFSYKEISYVVSDFTIENVDVELKEPELRLAFINYRSQKPMANFPFELEIFGDLLLGLKMKFIDILRLLHDQPPTSVAEVVASSPEPE